MSEEQKQNLIPDDYWHQLTEKEQLELQKLYDEMSHIENVVPDSWDEMDESYFQMLRERFNKTESEISQRKFKTYMNSNFPFWLMVVPAGRQRNGETIVQYFHTIIEDMEDGECNGEYQLLTESELEEKFNIKYNN